MYVEYTKEFLARCDDLQLKSDQGSWDNWFIKKFKLTRTLNWNWFRKLYQRTYTLPFARKRFRKEVRHDLNDLYILLKKLNAKRGKNDYDTCESIRLIDEYLEKNPKLSSKPSKINKILWAVLSSSIFSSLFAPVLASAEQYYPVILIVGIMFAMPLGTWYMADRFFQYLMEKLWYRTCERELGISTLRNKIKDELILEINL